MSVGSVGSALNAYSVSSVGKPAAQTTPPPVASSKSVVVAISAKAAKVGPSSIADAITAYQAAAYAGTLDKLGPITISDTSANLGSNFTVLAEMASKSKITSIKLTDKNASITTTMQLLGNLTDKTNAASSLFQKIDSKLTVVINSATVKSALSLKSLSKNVLFQFAIADTANAIALNIDALSVIAKSKGAIRGISITSNDNILSITSDQLKNNSTVLALTSSYILDLKNISLKDFLAISKNERVKSVSISDSSTNILKSTSIINSNQLINSASFTDKKELSFTISEMMALKSSGKIKDPSYGYVISDNALNVIAHIRFDIKNIISGANSVSINDKTVANLTLDDARTLKSLSKLSKDARFNLVESPFSIKNNASKSDVALRENAEEVIVAQTYSISEISNLLKLKRIKRKIDYSIVDTAENILKEAKNTKSFIIKNSLTVTARDTAINIAKNIDGLDILSQSGQLNVIELTDNAKATIELALEEADRRSGTIGKLVAKSNIILLQSDKVSAKTDIQTVNPMGSNGDVVFGTYVTSGNTTGLFSMNKDGSFFRDVTPDTAPADFNVWDLTFISKSSKYLGSFSDIKGNSHLFSMNADGTQYKLLDPYGSVSVSASLYQINNIISGTFSDANGMNHAFALDMNTLVFSDLFETKDSIVSVSQSDIQDQWIVNTPNKLLLINLKTSNTVDITPKNCLSIYSFQIPNLNSIFSYYTDLQKGRFIRTDLTTKLKTDMTPDDISIDWVTSTFEYSDNYYMATQQQKMLGQGHLISTGELVVVYGSATDGKLSYTRIDNDSIRYISPYSNGNHFVGVSYNYEFGRMYTRIFNGSFDSDKINYMSLPENVWAWSADLTISGKGILGQYEYFDSNNWKRVFFEANLDGSGYSEISTPFGNIFLDGYMFESGDFYIGVVKSLDNTNHLFSYNPTTKKVFELTPSDLKSDLNLMSVENNEISGFYKSTDGYLRYFHTYALAL